MKGETFVKYNFLRFPNGKPKAVTLSYDDGCNTDTKLIETIEKYGIKCTFNLVGSTVEKGEELSVDFIKKNILGKGHEIANHGYYHRGLDCVRPIEGIRDTLDSRLCLEKTFGIIVRGMAFPDRNVNRFVKPDVYAEVKNYLKELDIAYSRLPCGNESFELPDDWYSWAPTTHHKNPNLMKLADEFLNLDLSKLYIASRSAKVFYMWGHSFEFENNGNWELLDEICLKLCGKDDVWYATNIDIYNYVRAYSSLVYSADGKTAYNPTLIDVWADIDGETVCIKSGETKKLK